MSKRGFIKEYRSNNKEICNSSKEMIETMLIFCPLYMETYNPLFRNCNNITKWLNLKYLNLSNNNIGDLPMELGTLPFLQKLNLSKNNIGICYRYGWLWIKQAEIRNTLHILNISRNSITELPYYIRNLSALKILNVSYNILRVLPHSIADMKNLSILDVSYNLLLSLPREICSQWRIVDVSMNPCLVKRCILKTSFVLPSLVEISAATLQRYGIQYECFIPNLRIEYIDNLRRCYFCKQYCKICYVRIMISSYLETLTNCVIVHMSENRKLVYTDYVRCSPACYL